MYSEILVSVDGSATSNIGLSEAIGLARALGSELTIIHVIDELGVDYAWGSGLISGDVIDSLREQGNRLLLAATKQAVASAVPCCAVLVKSLGRRVADHIIEQAERRGVNLIVMGTHGRRGFRRLVIGSEAEEVVRRSSIPVLLLRAEAQDVLAAGQSTPTVTDV
jgi:nucleotide-binding universal stress UspA family protein